MRDKFTRRSFLGASTAATVALAGCSALEEATNDSSNPGSGGGSDGMSMIDNISRNYSVQEDHWKGVDFSFQSSGELRYDAIVRDGPEIDIIVMEQSEYPHFEDGERYEYLPSASSLDTAGADLTADMPAGEYSLLVDNSSRGEASPPTNLNDDIAEVEIDIQMYS